MYIYSPHLNMYLYINKTTGMVSWGKEETITTNASLGWENWEENEDGYGNKRLCYAFPDGEYYFLTRLTDFYFCQYYGHNVIYLFCTKTPGLDKHCFHEHGHLYFQSPGSRHFLCQIQGISEPFNVLVSDALTEEELNRARVEMFCELPHLLK